MKDFKEFAAVSCIVLFLLNLSDYIFTKGFVATYGTEIELNPMMRYMMEHYGIGSVLYLKCLLVVILYYFLTKVTNVDSQRRSRLWVLFGCWTYLFLTIYHIFNYSYVN